MFTLRSLAPYFGGHGAVQPITDQGSVTSPAYHYPHSRRADANHLAFPHQFAPDETFPSCILEIFPATSSVRAP